MTVECQTLEFARPRKTYTGKNCLDCLKEQRNHCLLRVDEGLCCDRGDPQCRQMVNGIDPTNRCAEDANYDYFTSVYTCPTAQRCPQGNSDLYVNQYDQINGFSDSWGWFQYIQDTVCKFRVRTGRPKSNIILNIDELSGSAKVMVFIMLKDKFGYPQKSIEVTVSSPQKSFNISGDYFEFLLYIIPDTHSSGSYRVNTFLEAGFQPAAFQPKELPDGIKQEVQNKTLNVTEVVVKDETTLNKTQNNPESIVENNSNSTTDQKNVTVNKNITSNEDQNISSPTNITQESKTTTPAPQISPETIFQQTIVDKNIQTNPKSLLQNQDSYILLAAIVLIVCILMVFFSVMGCCLLRHKSEFGQVVLEQQKIIKTQNAEIQHILTEMENLSGTSASVAHPTLGNSPRPGSYVRLKNGKTYKVGSFIVNTSSDNSGFHSRQTEKQLANQGIGIQEINKNQYNTTENPYLTEYSNQIGNKLQYSSDHGREGEQSNDSFTRVQRLAIDNHNTERYQQINKTGRNQSQILHSQTNLGEQIVNINPEQFNENVIEQDNNNRQTLKLSFEHNQNLKNDDEPDSDFGQVIALKKRKIGLSDRRQTFRSGGEGNYTNFSRIRDMVKDSQLDKENHLRAKSQLNLQNNALRSEVQISLKQELLEDNGDFEQCTDPVNHLHQQMDQKSILKILTGVGHFVDQPQSSWDSLVAKHKGENDSKFQMSHIYPKKNTDTFGSQGNSMKSFNNDILGSSIVFTQSMNLETDVQIVDQIENQNRDTSLERQQSFGSGSNKEMMQLYLDGLSKNDFAQLKKLPQNQKKINFENWSKLLKLPPRFAEKNNQLQMNNNSKPPFSILNNKSSQQNDPSTNQIFEIDDQDRNEDSVHYHSNNSQISIGIQETHAKFEVDQDIENYSDHNPTPNFMAQNNNISNRSSALKSSDRSETAFNGEKRRQSSKVRRSDPGTPYFNRDSNPSRRGSTKRESNMSDEKIQTTGQKIKSFFGKLLLPKFNQGKNNDDQIFGNKADTVENLKPIENSQNIENISVPQQLLVQSNNEDLLFLKQLQNHNNNNITSLEQIGDEVSDNGPLYSISDGTEPKQKKIMKKRSIKSVNRSNHKKMKDHKHDDNTEMNSEAPTLSDATIAAFQQTGSQQGISISRYRMPNPQSIIEQTSSNNDPTMMMSDNASKIFKKLNQGLIPQQPVSASNAGSDMGQSIDLSFQFRIEDHNNQSIDHSFHESSRIQEIMTEEETSTNFNKESQEDNLSHIRRRIEEAARKQVLEQSPDSSHEQFDSARAVHNEKKTSNTPKDILQLKKVMTSLDQIQANSGVHKSNSTILHQSIHNFDDTKFDEKINEQVKRHKQKIVKQSQDEDIIDTQQNKEELEEVDDADVASNYTSIPNLVVNNAPDRQNDLLYNQKMRNEGTSSIQSYKPVSLKKPKQKKK